MLRFKDQVAYICLDCRKGFRRHQLTPVRLYINNRKTALKCKSCIEANANDLVDNKVYNHTLTSAYKWLLNVN